MGSRPAVCGTKGGYNRHKRTLNEEPCDACRDAVNAARRETRKNPVQHRFCGCGREVRVEGQDKCALCRKASEWRTCVECLERPAYGGNRKCTECVEVDDTAVYGWIRNGRGILVGSQDPHNHPSNCTTHHWCDQQQRDEEAA